MSDFNQTKRERKAVQLTPTVHGRLMTLLKACSTKLHRPISANEAIGMFLDAQEKSPVI